MTNLGEVLGAIVTIALAGCQTPTTRATSDDGPARTSDAAEQALYRCSMDGGERATPGPCPKCGMRLGEESRVR